MTIAESPPLTLGEIVEHLGRYVDRFEVGELSPDDAARAAKRFGRVKRMAQTAELLCIKRAAETSRVRRRDDVDGSKWAGRQLGTTPGHATELLNLAGGLEAAPQTLEALKAGDISTEQAAEVVRTEKVAPGSERDMLDEAGRSSLTELKRRGRKVRSAAIGPDEQAAQVHRGRYLRAWVDDDGAGRGSWSLDLAEHTQFMALVEAHTDLVFQEARREGRREPMDAYRADALVRVATAALRSSQRRRRPTSSTSTPDGSASPDPRDGGRTPSGTGRPDSDGRGAKDSATGRNDDRPKAEPERSPSQDANPTNGESEPRTESHGTQLALGDPDERGDTPDQHADENDSSADASPGDAKASSSGRASDAESQPGRASDAELSPGRASDAELSPGRASVSEPPTEESRSEPPSDEPPPGGRPSPPSGPPPPRSPRAGPSGSGRAVHPTDSAAERPSGPPPADGHTSSPDDPGPEAPAPAEVLVHVSHQLLLEGSDGPRGSTSASGATSGLGPDRLAGDTRSGTQLELGDLAGVVDLADAAEGENAADTAPSTRTADMADPADLASVADTAPSIGIAGVADVASTADVVDVAEIVGQGPIPVGVVRQWLGQGAFVAVVVTADDDPLDVRTVLHLGRRSPLVSQLWSPEHQPGGRLPGSMSGRPPAGPNRDTSARHIKVIVQLTEQELRHPTAAPLRAAVRKRGVDVASLVHRGRRPNAVQRTALQWRSPVCVVLGCSNRIRLEADHVIEWCLTRHTTLAELEHLCRQHHRMKTHDGYRLAPGTGKRPLLPP